MNVVDYVIIGLIGLSVLFGIYRGFVSSVLNTGGCLISFALSFWLYPKVAAVIQNNQGLVRTLMHYTDASSRIGDLGWPFPTWRSRPRRKLPRCWARCSSPRRWIPCWK